MKRNALALLLTLLAIQLTAVAAEVRVQKDIAYLGSEREEKLDLYMPVQVAPGQRCPGIVIIHGGGWTSGDKGAAREQNIGTTLAENGYVCVSVNYLLAKPGSPSWPQNLHDCKQAVRFLRANAEKYRIDSDHIGVIGGSAGGHLAAMVGLTGPDSGLDPKGPDAKVSCRVQAAVPMYGAAVVRKDTPMLPGTREQVPELYERASPINHISSDDPPFLILHGTADELVPVEQSEILAAALKKGGVPQELVIVEGAPHSFHLQPTQRDLRPLVLGFFDKHLKPARSALAGADGRSPSAEQLKDLLKRFPAADANGDGTLTVEEARAYRAKVQAQTPATPAAKPTHADVAYGPHERNVLDFYRAESKTPTPLIVFIHGGGFVGGNKNAFSPVMLRGALDAGISFASIHYRFVNGSDVIFPAPQLDGARAVQFLRSKAQEWNIDPNRVACYGGSAGAGISMWIGFHEDLANPKSDDPVLRQSTRITAIGTFGGQATYDPIKIKELIGGRAWEHPSLLKVYGLQSTEEALNPSAQVQRLYDQSSAITHLTKDDPPLFMVYNEADGPLPADARPGQGIHHPNFGRLLTKKMNELAIENIYVYTPESKGPDPNRQMLEFFQKHFAKAK